MYICVDLFLSVFIREHMKRFLFVPTLFILIFFAKTALATQAPPSPICSIIGKITELEFIKPFEKEISGTKITQGNNFEITILINSINESKNSNSSGGYQMKKCEELYKRDTEVVTTISKDKMLQSYRTGDDIEGLIHFSGDEFENGIYLTNFTVTNKTNDTIAQNPIKIDKKANGKFEVVTDDAKGLSNFPIRYDAGKQTFVVTTPDGDKETKATPKKAIEIAYITGMLNEFEIVDGKKNIVLIEKDGKIFYEVHGKKTGKIFGIWPVSYDVKAVIDDQGKLSSFEKPFILKFLKYVMK